MLLYWITELALLGVLSFALVYGMWYVGLAMDKIFSYAYGMRDWEWDYNE
jgi:hypothetical protein